MTTDTDFNPGIGKTTSPYPKAAPSDPQAPHVHSAQVRVDASADRGEIARIWESIGYDEFNWTYMPTGRELLRTFGGLAEQGVHVRPHYVFCSGSGFAIPHWGNGNVYHEDADGNPFYDFTMVDQAYDAIVEAGNHVLVELAFTPRDLVPDHAEEFTVIPSPTSYSSYEAGTWAYPPKDYERWGDLVTAHAQHCLERYGLEEVKTWLWELWNEPDIFYWHGTPQEFYELYSVTAAAVRKAIPEAKVGGPSVTGAGVEFLRGFLQHTRERNDPLDFVSFHTKGSAFTPWRVYGPTGGPAPEKQSPSANKMIFEVQRLLRVMAEFEEYRELPAIVDECDAGVPAHHTFYDNANFEFQNTEYYPVFQVKLMKKLLDLNETEQAKVDHATSWSFYFEGERYFEGTRSFLTAGGVEKPFLNAYRALAQLGSRRIEATSDAAQEVTAIDHASGRSMPEEIDALATRSDSGSIAVLVWRHTDDQYQRDDADAEVQLDIAGLAGQNYQLSHFRIDDRHSNSHTAWKEQGAPQVPSSAQLDAIKARQGLEQLEPPRTVSTEGGAANLTVSLPLPSVSLLVLEPRE